MASFGGGAGGVRRFTELTDTPSSYSGGGGKGVKVKATEDGLEFGDVASKFTELTDAPSSYSGAAGRPVAVNAAEDGLEFPSPWLLPPDFEIGPRSDTDANLYIRTKNIAGDANIRVYILPTASGYCNIGNSSYRIGYIYGQYSDFNGYYRGGASVYQDWRPASDNTYNCGDDTRRWALVRGVTITSGDLCFEEKECAVCGKPFKEGDSVVLKVYKVDDVTRTVPIHKECNPHPLDKERVEEHIAKLKERRRLEEQLGLEEDEFQIIGEDVHDGVLSLRAIFGDGIEVSVAVEPDATEEDVIKALKEMHSLEKERRFIETMANVSALLRQRFKIKRSWVGFRGKCD